jgi:hypothetical protein
MAAKKSTATRKSRTPAVTRRSSEKEKLADELANFCPAIDHKQMERLETAASSLARGQQRRCMLAVCATSADTLSKCSIDLPEEFGEMRELVEIFYKHAKALADTAYAATLRLRIADCREEASHG